MKKDELFDSIFEFSQRFKKEYAEYVSYCEKKTGRKNPKLKNPLEYTIALLTYASKRNMVVNRTIISTILELAAQKNLPPPKEQ